MKAKTILFIADRLRMIVFSFLVLISGLIAPVWTLDVVRKALDQK